MLYHSCFHSVMTYGLTFWVNSSHATKMFKLQKRAIQILMGCGIRESCRDHFKKTQHIATKSQYILSNDICSEQQRLFHLR